MENGLGRAGYLMLAGVLFMLGAFGLVAAYLAYGEASATFFHLGLGVTAFALVGLLGFAAWAPWLAGGSRVVEPAASTPEPVQEPTGTASAASQGTATTPSAASAGGGPTNRSIEFEFSDPEPAANAAPDDLVLPDAFQNRRPPAPGPEAAAGRDPTAWPQRRGARKNDWATQMEHRQRIDDMVEDSPVRAEMQERYTRTTPTVRGILHDAPLHLADRAPDDLGPGFAAPGMSVGQCGRCKTMVMAPDERPLRLKCPECAKITALN